MTNQTEAGKVVARFRAKADSEAGRFQVPARLAPASLPDGSGYRIRYEDGSVLVVRELPVRPGGGAAPAGSPDGTRYGTGRTPDGWPTVTCTTPDKVTAGMLIMRTEEGAAAVAAALNLDGAAGQAPEGDDESGRAIAAWVRGNAATIRQAIFDAADYAAEYGLTGTADRAYGPLGEQFSEMTAE